MQNLFDIDGIEPNTLSATKVMESGEDNRLKKS